MTACISPHLSIVLTIGFDITAYEVIEGEKMNLVVQKSGPVESTIIFRVFSEGFVDEERTFAGVTGPDTVTISTICPDDVIGHEVYVVTLSLVDPDPHILVSPSQANVTVTDDDGVNVIDDDSVDDAGEWIRQCKFFPHNKV